MNAMICLHFRGKLTTFMGKDVTESNCHVGSVHYIVVSTLTG